MNRRRKHLKAGENVRKAAAEPERERKKRREDHAGKGDGGEEDAAAKEKEKSAAAKEQVKMKASAAEEKSRAMGKNWTRAASATMSKVTRWPKGRRRSRQGSPSLRKGISAGGGLCGAEPGDESGRGHYRETAAKEEPSKAAASPVSGGKVAKAESVEACDEVGERADFKDMY
ncbi:hypothetical protein HK101_010660 [Irineochytrium annulatum]|nr:hypothetical protein HK101_010660 [Irineochytrium annulatum]